MEIMAASQAKISIIMPVFNCDRYVKDTIESIQKQTFPDFELIVIDDGSTDDTLRICREQAAKDHRIVVLHQDREGVACARNKGLDAAHGEFLMFCDGDDGYMPTFCERMYSLISTQDVDAVVCGNEYVYDDDVPQDIAKKRLHDDYRNPGRDEIVGRGKIMAINTIIWNKIFRRSICQRYGIRFPDGHEHDDTTFWRCYAMVAKHVQMISDKLYRYRIRLGSVMDAEARLKPRNRYDRIAAVIAVFDFARRHNLGEQHCGFLLGCACSALTDVRRLFTHEEINALEQQIIEAGSFIRHGRWHFIEVNGAYEVVVLSRFNRLALAWYGLRGALAIRQRTRSRMRHKAMLARAALGCRKMPT